MEPKPVRDDAGAQQTMREVADRRIPEPLVERLHELNARAADLKRQLEATLHDADYEQTTRAASVGEEMRKAERELEDVERQIREAAPPQAKAT